jgi:hypothetical protein
MMERSTNPEEWLDQPVEILKLSARVWHVLRSAGCRKIRDVVMLEENEILMNRNFGKKSFQELTDRLAELGLRLEMFPGPQAVKAMFSDLSPGWVVIREEKPDACRGVIIWTAYDVEDFEERAFGEGDRIVFHPGRRFSLAPGLFAIPYEDIIGIPSREWLDRENGMPKGGS